MRMNRTSLVSVSASVVATLVTGASAANITWLGGGGGDPTAFDNGLNWQGDTAPADNSNTTGDVAILPATVTANLPTVTASQGLKGLQIDGSGWTLGGAGTTLTIRGSGPAAGNALVTNNASGTNTIDPNITIVSTDQANVGFNVATGGTLVLNGNVARTGSGGGAVLKSGGGLLEMNGGGGMYFGVNEGTVRVMAGTGGVDSATYNQPLTIQGTGTYDVYNISPRIKDLEISAGGTLTNSSATLRTVETKTAGSKALAGLISGALEMRYGTNGSAYTFTVTNDANTYTGPTRINTNMTLSVAKLANGGVVSAIGRSSNAASSLVLGGGWLKYTGPAVTIDRGFTVLNNGGFDSSGTGALVVNGSMEAGQASFNSATFRLTGTNTDANTIAASINNGASSRTIGLSKLGAGTWRLTGASNYTLGTTIAAGTLLIDNTTGSGTGTGAVNVQAGTFGGTGSASGAVNVGNNAGVDDAFLSPGTIGTPIESLATGALTFNSDGVLIAQINSSLLTSDLVAATGAVVLGDGIATLQLSDLGNAVLPNNAILTLISSTVGVSGYFDGLAPVNGVGPQIVLGSNTLQLNYNPTSVTLSVVPEPTTLALLGLSVLPTLRRRFR